MVIERVPRLNMRPKHLIQVFASPETGPFDAYAANFDIRSLIANNQPIGGIQTLTIRSERGLYEWRELNYETLGRVMEVYPGLGTFEVDVTKVAFYKEHLLDAFKVAEIDLYTRSTSVDGVGASFNVYNQIKPLHIVVRLLEPNQGVDYNTPSTTLVLIYDCWFDKSEITFDVTTEDLIIKQSATLTAAGITAIK